MSTSKTYRTTGLRQLFRNRKTRFASYLISFLIFIALFGKYLANDKPIYAKYDGKVYFPVLYDFLNSVDLYNWPNQLATADWKSLELDAVFWPPVRYTPNKPDKNNYRPTSPFESQNVSTWKERHFLGTDSEGRDLLSGLIWGTRTSLLIGIVAMGIASLLGIFLGAIAGFWGDYRIKATPAQILMGILGTILGFFYGFQVRKYTLIEALNTNVFAFGASLLFSLLIFWSLVAGFIWLAKALHKLTFLSRKKPLRIDFWISRVMEVFITMPALLLIITVSGVTTQKSLYLIMAMLGLLSWVGIARFLRAELLKIRNQDYIQAVRAAGLPEWRILLRHALPNALGPVTIIIAFGMASAILVESSLSFLAIGVPEDLVTWGALLKEARNTGFQSWWLAIFPGFAIFATITLFSLLGEGLREIINPRLIRR